MKGKAMTRYTIPQGFEVTLTHDPQSGVYVTIWSDDRPVAEIAIAQFRSDKAQQVQVFVQRFRHHAKLDIPFLWEYADSTIAVSKLLQLVQKFTRLLRKGSATLRQEVEGLDAFKKKSRDVH